MAITCDWHIHSRNSCDGACMPVSVLVARAAEKGITDFGLTDHVHTPLNLPELQDSRREYLSGPRPDGFHFGVEVSCVSQWELDEIARRPPERAVCGIRKGGPPGAPPALALTEEDITALEIEYVVGGTHWPLYVPIEREAVIRDYHRQNMFLAQHPLVDIVAHPWWWHGHWANDRGMFTAEPWLDDFGRIPKSLHDEFAASVMANDKAVEINVLAMLLTARYPASFKRQYVEYLAGLKDRGAQLCIGSDCHDADYGVDFATAERMLAAVGLCEQDWGWKPRGCEAPRTE